MATTPLPTARPTSCGSARDETANITAVANLFHTDLLGTASLTITDDDCSGCGGSGDLGIVPKTLTPPPEEAPQQQQEAQEAEQNPHADLIAKVRDWRNDARWVSYKAHTDRWDRVLLALGETVPDSSLTTMTAAEAQGYADRGWTRWVEVAAALNAIESPGP